MIKETISNIIMIFFIVIFCLMVLGMSGDTFSIGDVPVEGANTELGKKGGTILMALTAVLIIVIIVVMVLFGNNLLGLKLRYREGFTDSDDNDYDNDNGLEEFMGAGSCTKNLADEKLFCSTEHKKSLFTNLVSLDRKIDYLKKEFEKIKKKKK